jgi:hypothetical protein
MANTPRPGRTAIAFAIAAAASSWNPLAAPFGLAVGIAAIVLAARAMAAPGGKRLGGVALGVATAAAVASAAVLALTAGVGRGGGEPLVPPRTPAGVQETLDRAEQQSRAARERAARELEAVGGGGRGEERR